MTIKTTLTAMVAAAVLWGCGDGAEPVPPHLEVSYYFEDGPDCQIASSRFATAEEKLGAALSGFAMWREFDVDVLAEASRPEDAAERRDVASVCFGTIPDGERLVAGEIGWTDDGVRIVIFQNQPAAWWIKATAANLLGHLILESNEELPPEQDGVMNRGRLWWEFTANDEAFLSPHGLVRVNAIMGADG